MSTEQSYRNKELLAEIAQGNDDAFRTLVVQYRPELLNYIETITKSRPRAEEVVQDVFLQVWTARSTLNSIRNFSSFLFVISKHLALNALRTELREQLRRKKWAEANQVQTSVEQPAVRENTGVLQDAVNQLPPQQKIAWQLSRMQGKSLDEVAGEMNISKNTAKKYLYFANQSITAYLLKSGEILLVIALFWTR